MSTYAELNGAEEREDWGAQLDELTAARKAEAEQPAPVLAGTFAIYATPDGGYLLVTETDRGIDRKHIPGKFIKLATKGPMAKMFGGLFGPGGE